MRTARCESAGESGPRFVELARAVYQNNDRRAAVKRRINECLGSEIRREVLQGNRFRAHRRNYRLAFTIRLRRHPAPVEIPATGRQGLPVPPKGGSSRV